MAAQLAELYERRSIILETMGAHHESLRIARCGMQVRQADQEEPPSTIATDPPLHLLNVLSTASCRRICSCTLPRTGALPSK